MDRNSMFLFIKAVMEETLGHPISEWNPDLKFTDIVGWGNNMTVTTVVALQKKLPHKLPDTLLDGVVTINDLVTKATLASTTSSVEPPKQLSERLRVLSNFESLGEDCEFGLVQQRAGILHPHLLRFSAASENSAERLPHLIMLLKYRLHQLEHTDFLEMFLPEEEWNNVDPEWRIRHKIYKWSTHTGLLVKNFPKETINKKISDFSVVIEFMKSQFLRELELGRKVWIWKSSVPSSLSNIKKLHDILKEYGPNKLLWVQTANNEHLPGTVDQIEADLWCGYIKKPSEHWKGHWSEDADWFELLKNALQIYPELDGYSEGTQSIESAPQKCSSEQEGAVHILSNIASLQLNIPNLSLENIQFPSEISGWDSLKHVNIIMAVEEYFKTSLSADDFDKTQTVPSFISVINRLMQTS
ncbi:acyl carrier protein [Acetobacter cerevisiae]|uniref:Acyl carrier protein n=1 Tax=Acetobacter cerevisiae TaxID=178900 RepID=A0ABT1EQK0_9PROT|nr:acyl carrier protein [Acetobacter cerevisiae]MCP1245656.1 acyl carrier protein [Acetobacter cerevisiae]MCP1255198.1 acyl carrier protein [Acetobacter cerevisiae]